MLGGLANLGIKNVTDVRIGRHIHLSLEASSAEEARLMAEEAAQKLLANPVMEEFQIVIS